MTNATALDAIFNSAGRFELLTEEQVIELSRRTQAWQQYDPNPESAPIQIRMHGIAARDKLVRHNLRLVLRTWKTSYYSRINSRHPGLADAIQRATCELVRAAEKFDATTGHKFSTYATPWIHKGFKAYLSDEERTVRVPTNNFFLVRSAMAEVTAHKRKTGDNLTLEALHERMAKSRRNMPKPETLGEWIAQFNNTAPRSFSEPVGEDTSLGDMLCDEVVTQDEGDALLERVRYGMQFLTEFEQKVIHHRYLRRRGGIGHRAIARLLGSTMADVAAAEDKALTRIKTIAAVD